MATNLKKLLLEELSLVDNPANKQAEIVLFKRADPKPLAPAIAKVAPALAAARPNREEADMTSIAKAEAALDALVAKRRDRYDESEPVAMAKVLTTPEGKAAYREMMNAKDLAVAKGSTLLTHGPRPTSAPSGAPATGLEQLVAKHAAENRCSDAAAYDAVLKTAEGKRLYRESLGGGA